MLKFNSLSLRSNWEPHDYTKFQERKNFHVKANLWVEQSRKRVV